VKRKETETKSEETEGGNVRGLLWRVFGDAHSLKECHCWESMKAVVTNRVLIEYPEFASSGAAAEMNGQQDAQYINTSNS
jgi:hypothetical protein